MTELGAYAFLPWLRQGLANRIRNADLDPSVRSRVQVDVQLNVRGQKPAGGEQTAAVTRSVTLFASGDIVGIDRRAILRVERGLIANFERTTWRTSSSTMRTFWRYTPRTRRGEGRLRPCSRSSSHRDGSRRLAALRRCLPSSGDRRLFLGRTSLYGAHVRGNLAAAGELVSRHGQRSAKARGPARAERPRLPRLCPRKLAESTAYHAFVIPTFESGRRAGLGLDNQDVVATASAWDDAPRPEPQRHPYYHRWQFRTGTNGDFETLVRLLTPKPADRRVGTREVDMQFPGSTVSGVDKPELDGVLKLGGALRPPVPNPPPPPDVYDSWDDPMPRPLQEDLARLLNLPDDYKRSADPDPVLAPPLYGRWHLTSRVLTNATATDGLDNWIHRLNLVPDTASPLAWHAPSGRVDLERGVGPGGTGARAQQKIRFAQLGLQVSQAGTRDTSRRRWRAINKGLMLVAPLNTRILSAGQLCSASGAASCSLLTSRRSEERFGPAGRG